GSGENEIILRREVLAEGKSRLLVNDQPVTLAAARQLAGCLAEIHAQNEHVALLDPGAQLQLLDDFTGAAALRAEVAHRFGRCRELREEMAQLTGDEQERLRRLDLLRFQAEELRNARLAPGEDERLESEKRLLANVEKLRVAASAAFANLYEEEGAVCSRLGLVARALDELGRYDSALAPQMEPLSSVRATLEDLAVCVRDYLGKLEADPRRLEEIEDRIAQIDRLKRKYGKTTDEMLAYAARAEADLVRLECTDERRGALGREIESAEAEYRAAAEVLSEKRQPAARALEKKVRAELSQLGMEKARFEFSFAPRGAPGPQGVDEIEIRISPNPGEDLRPLARIASGGELSRVMLALKTAVAENAWKAADGNSEHRRVAPGSRTFIFDEVDAGIGGRVAECVGQRLKRLAQTSQVFCVTHLPQIACFANHHYCVEKRDRGGRTITEVTYLNAQKDRAAELARMLSGSQITDAVLKHAAAMLKDAAD
ncbi:MAG: DNA repair protein RecN, partial [Terriglobia bacterium]